MPIQHERLGAPSVSSVWLLCSRPAFTRNGFGTLSHCWSRFLLSEKAIHLLSNLSLPAERKQGLSHSFLFVTWASSLQYPSPSPPPISSFSKLGNQLLRLAIKYVHDLTRTKATVGRAKTVGSRWRQEEGCKGITTPWFQVVSTIQAFKQKNLANGRSSSLPPGPIRGELNSVPCQRCALTTGVCYATAKKVDGCYDCADQGLDCEEL